MDNTHLKTFSTRLGPAVVAALERGFRTYGEMWREMMRPTYPERAAHIIDTHVAYRLAQAKHLVDYGDHEAAEAAIASAVGYLCVLLTELGEPEYKEGGCGALRLS